MTNTTAFVQLQWHNDELTMTKYGAVALRTCKSKLTKKAGDAQWLSSLPSLPLLMMSSPFTVSAVTVARPVIFDENDDYVECSPYDDFPPTLRR